MGRYQFSWVLGVDLWFVQDVMVHVPDFESVPPPGQEQYLPSWFDMIPDCKTVLGKMFWLSK